MAGNPACPEPLPLEPAAALAAEEQAAAAPPLLTHLCSPTSIHCGLLRKLVLMSVNTSSLSCARAAAATGSNSPVIPCPAFLLTLALAAAQQEQLLGSVMVALLPPFTHGSSRIISTKHRSPSHASPSRRQPTRLGVRPTPTGHMLLYIDAVKPW